MAGQGSRDQDPARRGSPASDEQASTAPERPGTRGPWRHIVRLVQRFDDAVSRTFMAMAMAEDGTRDLALEQLEGDSSDRRRDGDADPDPDATSDD